MLAWEKFGRLCLLASFFKETYTVAVYMVTVLPGYERCGGVGTLHGTLCA
jgi:hypothetical protein